MSTSGNIVARFCTFMSPVDGRYEDLRRGHWALNVTRDLAAGAVVAMIAIPLAMGFAMASGLRPEQGILGGAVAGLVGALFGGSKYQVYGPTAAFIPIIAAMMATYDLGFLITASLIAGVLLMIMGLAGMGRIVDRVPQSIVVGFTIGIAVVIGLSQIGQALGLEAELGYDLIEKLHGLANYAGTLNPYAVAVAASTFVVTKYGIKISPYIPAPLVALGLGTVLADTVWSDKGLDLIRDEYGTIPTDFWVVTLPEFSFDGSRAWFDLAYFAVAIVFVSSIESLLCSRMADRLADNKGKPFDPNKELWGQGMVQVIVPLLNGFPHTGALARTATNIRLGAVSPLAGIFKCVIKLALAAYLATFLERVPMACIAGVLIYVASAMVKGEEVRAVNREPWFHRGLMIYTAVMVPVTDFLTGVLTALAIYVFAGRMRSPWMAALPTSIFGRFLLLVGCSGIAASMPAGASAAFWVVLAMVPLALMLASAMVSRGDREAGLVRSLLVGAAALYLLTAAVVLVQVVLDREQNSTMILVLVAAGLPVSAQILFDRWRMHMQARSA